MALTAIALCSRALLKIGATGIASFDEGTAEAEVAANLYPSLRDALLSSHPWNFATAQSALPRMAAVPAADFANAFQLPPGFLRALSAGAGASGRGLRYRIHERRLHTDADAVTLTYVFRPGEEAFPAFFDQALIMRLAAEFCLPLTESTSRAELLHKLAEEEIRRARLIDAQEDTPAAIQDFSLIEARR
ncbi:hypothetical protein C882_1988 [Caenispirillum salinarum AK4]|uniref:Uncharacterized protein n=1 Tax=Caenispirillum salinarum AK4 TaxID=1238182 RepID=K9GQQ9_9PROT|nr:hypothetical protein [Caenispirillum salinarum]EKV27059.1 hypothetical protein C882_1988 [Caenispirillum salinarum AK4]